MGSAFAGLPCPNRHDWTARSTKPGRTVIPSVLMIWAPSGTGVEAIGPTARMVSPSMTTTPLRMAAPSPVQTVPPTSAIGGAAAKAADQHRQPDKNKAIPRITVPLQVQPTASTGQAILPNGTAADAAKGPKRASRALPHTGHAA